MRACKHCCDVKMFCFSRANHARSSLKKFSVDNSTSSFYLPTSSSAETWKSLQTCCVNYFVRLRWHFKRENLIRILENIFNAKQNVKLTVCESTTTTTNFRSKARVWNGKPWLQICSFDQHNQDTLKFATVSIILCLAHHSDKSTGLTSRNQCSFS